jgi:hypothetical protein
VRTLPRDHGGEHREDLDESDEAPDNYAHALARFREDAARAAGLKQDWDEAELLLEQLQCNGGATDEWPCVLRRGHDDEHENPTELQLVP